MPDKERVHPPPRGGLAPPVIQLRELCSWTERVRADYGAWIAPCLLMRLRPVGREYVTRFTPIRKKGALRFRVPNLLSPRQFGRDSEPSFLHCRGSPSSLWTRDREVSSLSRKPEQRDAKCESRGLRFDGAKHGVNPLSVCRTLV